MMMDLSGLIQIGINNVLVARSNGRELSIYELRMLDQFSKTTQVSLKLSELQIQQELKNYDEYGNYTGNRPPEDPLDEVTGGHFSPN